MIFIGYEPNTKGYCFWSKERRQVFISTNAIFNKNVFSYCSRDKEDRFAPISVEEEDPIDDFTKDDIQRQNPEPSQDILIPISLGLDHQPNQPYPLDDGHSSGPCPPSTIPWEPPKPMSPLFLDSPESSVNPPSYHTLPLRPAVKWDKPNTGHQNSISDCHQHKCYMLTDSSPSSPEENSTEPSGFYHESGCLPINNLTRSYLNLDHNLISITLQGMNGSLLDLLLNRDDPLAFPCPGFFLITHMVIDQLKQS